MKLTVTPIGGVGRSAAAVARAVVAYLQGAPDDPAVGVLGAAGMAAYLADSLEGPGRWLGAGAAWHGLAGVVDREAFQRVLEGRHPVTGARLITAQGSSQRCHLAVGTAARFDEHGEALYTIADAAVLLDVSKREVEAMIADPDGIASLDTAEGTLIADAEITRLLETQASPVTAAEVLAHGDPDELLTVTEAAALLQVTPRYVQRLCQRGDSRRAGDEDLPAPAGLAAQKIRGQRGDVYRIRRGDVAEFAARREPPVARIGYDCTLTVEKSISVVALLSAGQRQQRFLDAVDVANRTATGHLDAVASVARRGGQIVRSEGLVTASFVHGTSRALDPHHHHHNVVANSVVDDHGAVRAVDARALYRHAPEAAALATAALRWELRDLGLGWWQRDNGVWEIAGCDDAVIAEFSQRRHDIAEIRHAVAARLGRPVTGGEDHTIWAETRADKDTVTVTALLADWRQRAATAGFDLDACFDRADRALVYGRLPERHVATLLDHLADPEHGLCASRSDFNHADAVRAIADWALGDGDGDRRKVLLPPDEIVRLADRFCGDERVVVIDPGVCGSTMQRRGNGVVIDDGQGELRYITTELLEVQAEVLVSWTRGRRCGAGITQPAALQQALADNPQLDREQGDLVVRWCTSGDQVQAAVGRAGTGKTTSMRAAAAAWRNSGYRVIGAAVKGEAARQLAMDAGVVADTVALMLTHARHGSPILDRNTVLIVDEASTVGDRDLAELLRLAETTVATIRLIGDPAQHGAVPTGGCFEYLTSDDDIATLDTVHRLTDPGERRRADLVRQARARQAITELQASAQLELTPSEADTYAAALIRWYYARNDGAPHPIVHGRNQQRRELNQLAQQLLIDDGCVDPSRSVTRRDGLILCVGDEVMARHGDRSIHPASNPEAWMRNGTTGTIVAIDLGATADNDTIHLHTDGGIIACPRAMFDRPRGGLDLCYAVTSYAVQGSTRDVSTSVATATTTRRELYVDITRGRRNNKVYGTTNAPPGDTDEHLPTIPRPLIDDLEIGLRKQTPPPVAVTDPQALDVIRNRRGRSLAALLAAERAGEPGLHATIERVAATIRQHGEHHPAPQLRTVLPPIPDSPHLAHRYRTLAGDLAVLQASTNTPRRRPRNTLEQALGIHPIDHSAAAEWQRLADDVKRLAVDITIAALRGTTNHSDTPRWLSDHLDRCAASGALANIDVTTLTVLVADIDEWRNSHTVDPSDPRPIGDRPHTEKAHFDSLAARLRLGQQDGSRGIDVSK